MTPKTMNVQQLKFETLDELTLAAATQFVQRAETAISRYSRFTVACSGGSTPKSLYSLLATEAWSHRVPWSNVHLFWGDERHVPPDHSDSNYRMVKECLISKVPIPPENVHRIKTEAANAEQVAIEYERTIQQFFNLAAGQFPKFDLILLGMGADGHTASLFPGTSAVHEQHRLVKSVWVEKLKTNRVTLTPPVLNNADSILFFVAGVQKAPALHAVLSGNSKPDLYPSQIIRPTHGELLWMVDRAAANLLDPILLPK